MAVPWRAGNPPRRQSVERAAWPRSRSARSCAARTRPGCRPGHTPSAPPSALACAPRSAAR
eukprot:scaffold106802_cov45-Phaeocystis_antarctica.AAC.4